MDENPFLAMPPTSTPPDQKIKGWGAGFLCLELGPPEWLPEPGPSPSYQSGEELKELPLMPTSSPRRAGQTQLQPDGSCLGREGGAGADREQEPEQDGFMGPAELCPCVYMCFCMCVYNHVSGLCVSV